MNPAPIRINLLPGGPPPLRLVQISNGSGVDSQAVNARSGETVPQNDSEKPEEGKATGDGPLGEALERHRQYLQSPAVNLDLKRLVWMRDMLEAWSAQSHNETTRAAFTLASKVLNLANTATVCEQAPRAEDRPIAVEISATIETTDRELELLCQRQNDHRQIKWVTVTLHNACKSIDDGQDLENVCAGIECRAKQLRQPILANKAEWRKALKNWPTAKVKHATQSHRPQFIVAKLLYPDLSTKELATKAASLWRNYRDAFYSVGRSPNDVS